jgi:hypothetical protein
MSAASMAEGYLIEPDLSGVVADYLLSGSGAPNVFLHLAPQDRVRRPAPYGLILADLADHDGVREDGRTVEMLRARS